jgi:hypothetical protein
MTQSIRSLYGAWPSYNRRLRDAVASLNDEHLASRPSPERWPLWATIGHLACQRVSGLCGLAGEPGAETTPFPNALYECPGDEYLEPVMNARQLADALDSTFAIVEGCLDRWTFDDLGEEIRHRFGDEEWVGTRASIMQRAFAHDAYHCAEINEALATLGLPRMQLWDE